MFFVPFSIEKSNLVLLVWPLCPTASETAVYRLLTFHVPNLISLFCCLVTYQSINQDPKFTVWMFRNKIRCYDKELLAPRQPPRWNTTTGRLFAAAFHIVGRSFILKQRTRHAVVAWTYLLRYYLYTRKKICTVQPRYNTSVHRNLRRCIEGVSKLTYCITGYCSPQALIGARWR